MLTTRFRVLVFLAATSLSVVAILLFVSDSVRPGAPIPHADAAPVTVPFDITITDPVKGIITGTGSGTGDAETGRAFGKVTWSQDTQLLLWKGAVWKIVVWIAKVSDAKPAFGAFIASG